MVRSQLPTKILRARQRLNELALDETLVEKMQRELLRRREPLGATTALNEVRLKLDELERLLESIEPQTDEKDRRAAEFARRSFARFRYLQEASADLPIRNDDDIGDVVACLLHASSRDACFSVGVQRVVDDKSPEQLDRRAGYLIEPFAVEKK